MKRTLTQAVTRILVIAAMAMAAVATTQTASAQERVLIELQDTRLYAPSGWAVEFSDGHYSMTPPGAEDSPEYFATAQMDGDYTTTQGDDILRQVEGVMDEISTERVTLLDNNEDTEYRILGYGFEFNDIEFRTLFSLVKVESKVVLCMATCPVEKIQDRANELSTAVETIGPKQEAATESTTAEDTDHSVITGPVKAALSEQRMEDENTSPLAGIYQSSKVDGTRNPIFYVFNDGQYTQVIDVGAAEKQAGIESLFSQQQGQAPLVVGMTPYRIDGSNIVDEDGSTMPFEMARDANGMRVLKMILNDDGVESYWQEIQLD